MLMHYYDYHRILSYNCPVNVLIGERGCGKSYGAKKFVIEQFIKKHSQFLYLRRYDNELKEIFEKTKSQKDFFDDIKNEFQEHTLEAKNRKFYCDSEVFGFAKRMTEAQDLKSSVYQNVKIIIIADKFYFNNGYFKNNFIEIDKIKRVFEDFEKLLKEGEENV